MGISLRDLSLGAMSRRKVKFQTSVKESEQSEAMEIFLLFESGNSGHLTLSQFKQALYEMEDQDHTKVEQLFKTIDVDGNGTIDFEEFLLLFKFKQPRPCEKENTR